LQSDLALLANELFLNVFETGFDVELIEAIEDVEEEELFDCFKTRVLELFDVTDLVLGTFGMAKKLEEPFAGVFFNDFCSLSRLIKEVECLSTNFSLLAAELIDCLLSRSELKNSTLSEKNGEARNCGKYVVSRSVFSSDFTGLKIDSL